MDGFFHHGLNSKLQNNFINYISIINTGWEFVLLLIQFSRGKANIYLLHEIKCINHNWTGGDMRQINLLNFIYLVPLKIE